MPTAGSCASLVCGSGDGGLFETYPSDCSPAGYSADYTFCGTSATSPHSVHYYQCSTSILGYPCWKVSLGTTGGVFCCVGAYY
jgi:hypothetical protein